MATESDTSDAPERTRLCGTCPDPKRIKPKDGYAINDTRDSAPAEQTTVPVEHMKVLTYKRMSVLLSTTSVESEAGDKSTVTTRCGRIKYLYDRGSGLLEILIVLVFGIILYVVDVGSDIMAAVHHFQQGHPVWGSLTIIFVILPALSWAAVSWTWWYTYDFYDKPRDNSEKLQTAKRMRRMRMVLAVLLLDPITR